MLEGEFLMSRFLEGASTAGAAHLLMIDPSSSLFPSLCVPSRLRVSYSSSRNASLNLRPPGFALTAWLRDGCVCSALRFPAH